MTFSEGQEKLARALLRPINPAVAVLLGFYTTLWGLWIANPFWTVFTQAPLYNALEQAWVVKWAMVVGFSPEAFWGMIAIICGLFIMHGAMKRSYRSLIRGATIACIHWLTIAILYFMGDWQNTGGITSLIFAVYGAFLWVNVRVNFKDRHRMDDVLQ